MLDQSLCLQIFTQIDGNLADIVGSYHCLEEKHLYQSVCCTKHLRLQPSRQREAFCLWECVKPTVGNSVPLSVHLLFTSSTFLAIFLNLGLSYYILLLAQLTPLTTGTKSFTSTKTNPNTNFFLTQGLKSRATIFGILNTSFSWKCALDPRGEKKSGVGLVLSNDSS